MNRREFAGITSLTGLLLPYHKMFGSLVGIDKIQINDDLKKQSIAAFQRFESVWDFNDFWKRGNTFDACLTFADALHNKWPNDAEIISIQKTSAKCWKKITGFFIQIDPAQMWADHFGWWGLMGIDAAKHLKRIGNIDLATNFTQLSITRVAAGKRSCL